jgi:hypothetical protein
MHWPADDGERVEQTVCMCVYLLGVWVGARERAHVRACVRARLCEMAASCLSGSEVKEPCGLVVRCGPRHATGSGHRCLAGLFCVGGPGRLIQLEEDVQRLHEEWSVLRGSKHGSHLKTLMLEQSN